MSKKSTYEELRNRVQGLEKDVVTHKTMVKALSQSQKMLARTESIAHIGSWEWEIATDTVTWSEELFRIFQLDPNDRAPSWAEHAKLYHPEDFATLRQAVEVAIADGTPYEIELRALRKDGEFRVCKARGFVEMEPNEQPVRLFGSLHDITERKLAEEVLKERTKTLNDILENAGDGICVCHNIPEWPYVRFTHWNPRMTEISGYTIDEINRLGWYQTMYPDPKVQRQAIERMAKMRQGDDILAEDWVVTAKGGNQKELSMSTTVLKEDNGRTYVLALMKDISERKRYEEQLIASRKEWKEIFHAIGHPAIILDPEHGIIEANEATLNITGLTEYEIKNKKCFEIFHNKDSPPESCPMEALLHKGAFKTVEMEMEALGGTFLVSCTPVIDNDGNLVKIIHIATDITNLKRAEEEKRKALEFTAEQSKHALIGQVAGKMAHDFNNVLMGIMGNAQLAIMNCDDGKTKEKLERINEFSERGRDITNNLISFSKDQEPKQTYFKIEDKIELALKMLEKDLTGIQVSRNYKSGIPKLLADPGMIQDVLVNLVQNSIHAMSKVENPTLNLKAYSQDNKVYFEIEDNGCGIPKEHQDSIYTPSFTLKGSHDRTGAYKLGIKGTGYGMSNVKKYIIEKHKGDISLESEVGKGTRITIGLRVIKDHLSSDEKKEVVKGQLYAKRRILLVEDEPAIADVQYQILTKEPFSHIVSTAVNGQMAIDIFDRNEFDVVSLDYMLPGKINGLDVYYHIRENNKDIPVMFISGNIEFLESMKKLREKDPNLEHLSKPVDNLEYVNKINELIGRSILITK